MSWKKFIPRTLARAYHFMLALLGAILYRFPSRQITVIAVTGTKGKTTVTELVNAMYEQAGYVTALSNTVRFKIADNTLPNKLKMTTPGRALSPSTTSPSCIRWSPLILNIWHSRVI